MLTKIIEFSVRNKLIVGLFVLALLGYGAYQTTQLPIDAVPDITDNQVQIITVAPSFGATDIERLVTFPIEQANSNIAGMQEIRSFSRFGLSLVTIVFDDATDVYWARQQVTERLQQVQSEIPAGIGTPVLGPVSTGLGEIYQYVVKPKKGFEQKIDVTELRTIQDWIVRRQLLGVKGVAEVSSFGGKLKQYEIAINPNKLNAAGIAISDVFTAIENNNQNTGGAYIERGPTVLYIRSEGLVGSKSDIENIAIANKNSATPLFIRDIAEVNIGFATRYGAMCYNDKGEVSGAVVMMLKGANSSEVIKNVKERIAQIQKTLPEGVEIEPFLDRTKMVSNAIGTVETNLLEGALIVLFVLVVFLGNFRAGILVASVIPLAMLFAVCMMNLFGVSGNLMSLGALDFGLIVDGAVIIVEAVMHGLAYKKLRNLSVLSSNEMDSEVTSAASKMMNSAVFGQIIILIVYLPIFTLQGIEGKMFKPMAQTVAFALLGAFILSLTYIPMMSAFFLSTKIKTKQNISDKIMQALENAYQNALTKVLRFPKLVLGSVIALFVAAIFTLTNLGGEFIPALEEGDFAVETRVLTGSNLKISVAAANDAAKILLKFPEVEKVVSKIGSGEVPTDPMPIEAQDLMIILKDKSTWTTADNFDDLAEAMGKKLADIPGVSFDFQYPVQMRFNELMTGAKQDVVCKIFGENLDTLAKYADLLGKQVAEVRGAESPYIETVTGMPEIIINYNRPLIAQYHLTILDINRAINTAFAGQSAGLIFEDEKRFDLVVRLANTERSDLEDVQNLLIATPNGTQIPLSQLAEVRIQNGPKQIQREDAKRRIVVGFNVKDVDVQTVVEDLQAKVAQKIKLQTGYFITYGGAFENLNKAKQRLMIAVPVSLLLIFVLLFFAFQSVKQGLLIYTAIPLSAIGGIFLLALRGMPFSISAGIGFIALFGVAVLNGIVLIAEFNRLKNGGMQNLVRLVLTGTRLRLRPVLMTAFVASFGFLPMAISNGSGAEVQRPLATVVIGGLLVATLLTLFVLPLLYILVEKIDFSKKTVLKNRNLSFLFMFTYLPYIVQILLFVLCINTGFAQQNTPQQKTNLSLNLDDAIKIALQNSKQIKSEVLKAEYAKAMIQTAYDIPKTNTSIEFGQINSAYNDTKFGIAQSIAFPTVYKKQTALLNENWNATVLSVALHEYELKKAVTQAFYQILYLQEKQQLLRKADTLYTKFYNKASLRLQQGESNILEKTTAEMQKNSVALQIRQQQQAIDQTNLSLQLLLNANTRIDLVKTAFKMPFFVEKDTLNLENNLVLKSIAQQKNIAAAQTAVEETKLLPDFSLAYFNNSFRGTGADNVTYDGTTRFNSVQIGVDIPIFTKSQKTKIAASRLQGNILQNEYENEVLSLQNKAQQLALAYRNHLETVAYFENTALKNAQIITQTANQQFANGDINYLDFVLLTHQTIATQNEYIEAINALNETVIALQFLNFK